MKEICGCCEGLGKSVPLSTANRPYLNAITYRVGTHATFLETMIASLTDHRLAMALESGKIEKICPLRALKVRGSDDPSIAILDAWAVVADVLTFYQERIANEGYLRTATERRSILELARLVGYNLRPGVSASVFLAFDLEKGYDLTIEPGMRAQSLPGPGELPQSFETGEPLEARAEWNRLGVRMTQPQNITRENVNDINKIYLKGTATRLEANDLLLFDFSIGNPIFRQVRAVDVQIAENRTVVTTSVKEKTSTTFTMVDLLDELLKPPCQPPASPRQLQRSLKSYVDPGLDKIYQSQSDISPQLLLTFSPNLKKSFYPAWLNSARSSSSPNSIQALRVKAAPFGHLARPKLVRFLRGVPIYQEWDLAEEDTDVIYLDAEYDKILSQSWAVIERPKPPDDDSLAFDKTDDSQGIGWIVCKVISVRTISREKYGITATVTRLELDKPWLTVTEVKNGAEQKIKISLLRRTKVYAQSEKLARAEEEIEEHVCGKGIELDGLYEGLKSGRWLIVFGERADIPYIEGSSKVRASELVMLAGAVNGKKIASGDNVKSSPLPDDMIHTFIEFSESLKYDYRRDTVSIYANVARATHGETRNEILGSGDASRAFQEFQLRQHPLTYLAAATPAGAKSTLQVRVDDVLWHETDRLAGLEPVDRSYITTTDDESKTSIIFGNGEHGSRLPTSVENVKAVYRSGIGKPGNARAGQISLLAKRPLGVKAVTNPLPATGGADRENRDQARRNVPLAVLALDRLVSVQDYADFARTYAGIGKARASRLTDGRRQVVFITIAGAEDIPIDYNSDLYINLLLALHKFGDPHLIVQLEIRELLLLVISARVKVKPDFLWDNVEPQIRAELLDAFSFERRELGQDVLLSEAISAIEKVRGVDYVDVDYIGGIPEKRLLDGVRRILTPDEIVNEIESVLDNGPKPRIPVNLAAKESGLFRPDQIAYLSPDVPDTLILTELK